MAWGWKLAAGPSEDRRTLPHEQLAPRSEVTEVRFWRTGGGPPPCLFSFWSIRGIVISFHTSWSSLFSPFWALTPFSPQKSFGKWFTWMFFSISFKFDNHESLSRFCLSLPLIIWSYSVVSNVTWKDFFKLCDFLSIYKLYPHAIFTNNLSGLEIIMWALSDAFEAWAQTKFDLSNNPRRHPTWNRGIVRGADIK